MIKKFQFIVAGLLLLLATTVDGQLFKENPKLTEIGPGWSKTSINATIFRKNSLVSSNGYQFIAFYDSTGSVVLAKRKLTEYLWEKHITQYKGNVNDAHNVISIMVDGEGYLHMSWNHHNNPLHYCRSLKPQGLELGPEEPMTGKQEKVVSYPEFYRFNNGDLLFAYRDGGSGNGNLVLNRYSVKKHAWEQVQSNLIDGQQQRNAYWQLHVDKQSTIHLSWVWRETPNVATNHDMCYARSYDGGISWQTSEGKTYSLPITHDNAEVVLPIAQNSNLINQTSITADNQGNPYIATYFKGKNDSCTQFYVIYFQDKKWHSSAATDRGFDFSLGGMGSRSIPISRPQIVIREKKNKKTLLLIYRDEEKDNFACLASATLGKKLLWKNHVIGPYPLDRWEPSFDTELWKNDGILHLYFQKTGQGQGETSVDLPPQPVCVLEIKL